MKTHQTKKLAAIAAVCLALGGEAWACEQHHHHRTTMIRSGRHVVAHRTVIRHRPVARTVVTREVIVRRDPLAPSGNFLADTVTYPFRLVGRGFRTATRSPEIIGESLRGDRPFISDRGFFARPNGYVVRDTRYINTATPSHTETRGMYVYSY